MDKTIESLTVFFEEPFWVGVFKRVSGERLSVCKVTFGTEPKDYDVYNFILDNYNQLKFSPAVQTEVKKTASNPKRLQREVKKQLQNNGIGTKSQQALQLQREEMKTERRQISREQKEAEKERMFALKQQKRKQKHRGR